MDKIDKMESTYISDLLDRKGRTELPLMLIYQYVSDLKHRPDSDDLGVMLKMLRSRCSEDELIVNMLYANPNSHMIDHSIVNFGSNGFMDTFLKHLYTTFGYRALTIMYAIFRSQERDPQGSPCKEFRDSYMELLASLNSSARYTEASVLCT